MLTSQHPVTAVQQAASEKHTQSTDTNKLTYDIKAHIIFKTDRYTTVVYINKEEKGHALLVRPATYYSLPSKQYPNMKTHYQSDKSKNQSSSSNMATTISISGIIVIIIILPSNRHLRRFVYTLIYI